jgi:hypothetical protein
MGGVTLIVILLQAKSYACKSRFASTERLIYKSRYPLSLLFVPRLYHFRLYYLRTNIYSKSYEISELNSAGFVGSQCKTLHQFGRRLPVESRILQVTSRSFERNVSDVNGMGCFDCPAIYSDTLVLFIYYHELSAECFNVQEIYHAKIPLDASVSSCCHWQEPKTTEISSQV